MIMGTSGLRMILTLTLVLPATVVADDLYVDSTTGDDANDGRGWSTAKASVDAALSAASQSPGADVIRVASGTYTHTLGLTVVTDITLEGGYPVGGGIRNMHSSPTVLSTAGGPVLRFDGADRVTVDGFTITGGHGMFSPWGNGSIAGGIFLNGSRDITLRNLVITGNALTDYCAALGPSCPFMFPNDNPVGTAIYALGATNLRMENILVTDNTLDYIVDEDVQCAGGCTNVGIAPSFASTLYFEDCVAEISNLTVSDNTCQTGIAYCESAVGILRGAVTIVDSIISGNEADDYRVGNPDASYSDIGTGNIFGVNNISLPPQFVTGPLGDYYLSQLSAGQATDSPCVDAGSTTAAAADLIPFTTATAESPDIGTIDMGFHYPRDLSATCNLVAVDLMAPSAADMLAAYSSACGRLDEMSPNGRVAVAAPNVVSGASFDSSAVGVPGEVSLYQLSCDCSGTIKLTRDIAVGSLSMSF